MIRVSVFVVAQVYCHICLYTFNFQRLRPYKMVKEPTTGGTGTAPRAVLLISIMCMAQVTGMLGVFAFHGALPLPAWVLSLFWEPSSLPKTPMPAQTFVEAALAASKGRPSNLHALAGRVYEKRQLQHFAIHLRVRRCKNAFDSLVR